MVMELVNKSTEDGIVEIDKVIPVYKSKAKNDIARNNIMFCTLVKRLFFRKLLNASLRDLFLAFRVHNNTYIFIINYHPYSINKSHTILFADNTDIYE